MSIPEILYTILIYPLEFLFGIIFYLSNRIIANPGLSIVVLSLAVNFFVLPLYIRADVLQKEERETEERLSYWVSHIKKTFKGDEKFMMLQAYYRQNGYKPLYVFKSTLPLMLQVPFFIAAYRFLSNLSLLKGFPLGPVKDLGMPDAMLTIAGISVNVLPILMTLINIISGTIYAKGSSIKEKVQLYGIALIFLVLLYKSPAGLVFYWTLNNLFSLIKNVFYKFRKPGKVLSWLAFGCGIMLMLFVLPRSIYSLRQKGFISVLSVVIMLPALKDKFFGEKLAGIKNGCRERNGLIYALSVFLIALLTGWLIPSALISSSTLEFADVIGGNSPIKYVVGSMCMAFGLFIIWMGIYYLLVGNEARRVFSFIAWVSSIIFIIDYMFFGTRLGIMSSNLIFDSEPHFSVREIAINFIVIVMVLALCIVLIIKAPKFVTTFLVSGLIITAGFAAYNTIQIVRDYNEAINSIGTSEGDPEIHLSKDGKNVIVIMLDRYVSYYIPYILNEDPSLRASFSGFTYYPNTVSFGLTTNFGAPGLFGGYEYIPEKMNERDDILLVDKHNEALKLMPVLFDDNGFGVTVFDPPYANYKHIPDLSIYDDYPDIKKYLAEGKVGYDALSVESLSESGRKFFCYSLFKIAPVIIQPGIYNKGNYNAISDGGNIDDDGMPHEGQVLDGSEKAKGMNESFIKAYDVLDSLIDITQIEDSASDNFFMMGNNTSHDITLLSLPDYIPEEIVDNEAFGDEQFIKTDEAGNTIDLHDEFMLRHYHVDMAAFKLLAKWFDYLKEQNVYDNTRIILASDHAYNLWMSEEMLVSDGDEGVYNVGWFNCALLEKDFGSTEFAVNRDFMTNADVPTMAFDGIIDDPVNPFTGNSVNNDMKFSDEPELAFSADWDVGKNNGFTYKKTDWFTVHDDIFKNENWKYLGNY